MGMHMVHGVGMPNGAWREHLRYTCAYGHPCAYGHAPMAMCIWPFVQAIGFDEVYMCLDATRAAHIAGIGAHGTGFLTSPADLVAQAGSRFH